MCNAFRIIILSSHQGGNFLSDKLVDIIILFSRTSPADLL
jgi:hypothetical protein